MKSPQDVSVDQVSAQEIPEINELLQSAIDTFNKHQYEEAFQIASQAKAYRRPILNVDFFRAACLMHLGRPLDAREALREELHYFPTNTNAAKLLKDVLQAAPDTYLIRDPEFKEIYTRIRPYTMVPEPRLYSLFKMAKAACEDDIPGNFVECGVARGGSTVMLAIVIKRYSKRPRHHFGFDSFEGMPEPTEYDTQNGVAANETGWGSGTCSAQLERVQEVCKLLDVNQYVTLVPGYFEQTLAPWQPKINQVALLHLDADWYTSTHTILDTLYDSVVKGGFMQFDDYGCWDGCRKAVHEFQDRKRIAFDLQDISGDQQGKWMRKP